MTEVLDILVVGAGPTGLACGIEAVRAGLTLLIVEKGCLVNSLFSYPANMTFFTTRERLEIGEIPFSSINVKPTRAEALEYYRRVADFYHLPVRYQERVISIHPTGARQEPASSGNNPAPSLAAGAGGSFDVETEAADGKRRSY